MRRPHWGGVGGGGGRGNKAPFICIRKKISICFKSNHCYQIQYLIEKGFFLQGWQTNSNQGQSGESTK